MNKLKQYKVAIMLGVVLLFPMPFFLMLIFLSGDSCCGENTSGTMLIITLLVSLVFLLVSFFANLVIKLIFGRKWKLGNLFVSTIITWIISSGIYWPYVINLIVTAFYI